MSKSKIYEALLVISTAFLVIYLYGMLRHGESKELFIYIACGIGLSGIILKALGKLIAQAWYKLADILSLFMSKIIMSVIFILVLVPVALLYRLSGKDGLGLKRKNESTWIGRDHRYTSDDLKNLW